MDYNLFVNELIRLFKENTKKLKYIDIEALNLVKNQMDNSLGISYWGLRDLIIIERDNDRFYLRSNIIIL